jgi:hypothetical protein
LYRVALTLLPIGFCSLISFTSATSRTLLIAACTRLSHIHTQITSQPRWIALRDISTFLGWSVGDKDRLQMALEETVNTPKYIKFLKTGLFRALFFSFMATFCLPNVSYSNGACLLDHPVTLRSKMAATNRRNTDVNFNGGPGSSVGIATRYGLDSPGIENR